MNLYPEVMETKQGKQIGGFYSTPGQRFFFTLPNLGSNPIGGPIRGTHVATGSNLLIVVYGNQVVTVDINNTVVPLGHLNTSFGPVSIIDNGVGQYAVSDSFQLWIWSGTAWAMNTTVPHPGILTFQDGFGLISVLGTNQFYQSNLNDLTTFDPLSFSSADSEPSPISVMVSLFRQIWIFKEASTEIWNNAGLVGFSFQRMQGAFLEVGCIAPASVATAGDHLMWLAQNDQGSVSVCINQGYDGQRISTHPIDYQIIAYMQATQRGVTDAVGFAYMQAGHLFYVLTFPGGNATWVYDLATSLWHERGEFANGEYNRWDPNTCAFFNGRYLVGSSTGQQLSVLDLSYATDDLPVALSPINPKRWMRRWRALQKPQNEPVRFGSLRLDMQTGVAVAIGEYK